MSLAKSATVVSYGAQADGLLVTARRSPDAASSDQVLVAFLKDDYQLEAIVGWDALGMRGTCSSGYMLRGSGQIDQVLPIPYPQIHTRTMVPFAHLTWSAVWSGLAAGSVNRARLFFRDVARKSGGQLPPGAAHLTRAILSLRTLRGMVGSAILRYETIGNKMEELDSLEFQTNINLLKVSASELATATVISSMQACGLTGYRNDTKFSVGRHLRDVLSASVMINNDRILANASEATMMMEVPLTIRD
jgi:acyl-CoA dehydrogenase